MPARTSTKAKASAEPEAHETATARFNSTIGEGVARASAV